MIYQRQKQKLLEKELKTEKSGKLNSEEATVLHRAGVLMGTPHRARGVFTGTWRQHCSAQVPCWFRHCVILDKPTSLKLNFLLSNLRANELMLLQMLQSKLDMSAVL